MKRVPEYRMYVYIIIRLFLLVSSSSVPPARCISRLRNRSSGLYVAAGSSCSLLSPFLSFENSRHIYRPVHTAGSSRTDSWSSPDLRLHDTENIHIPYCWKKHSVSLTNLVFPFTFTSLYKKIQSRHCRTGHLQNLFQRICDTAPG